MQRSNTSTQSSRRKQIREKTDTNSTTLYGMPPPANNNTAHRLAQIDEMKYFFATATQQWNHNKALKRFDLIGGESISCVLWEGVFFVTGTDIVRSLTFRFYAFGRPVTNPKKFEEGIFSDLRNLKPGQDARLENPKSELLEMLYKNNCIRTQKKQKVFFWFSVPHDRLFLDALERDLKREKMGLEPTTQAVAQPATSVTLESAQELFTQLKKKTDHSSSSSSPIPQQRRPRVNSVPSIIGQKQQLQLMQQKQRQSYGSYFANTSPLPSFTTGRIQTNMYDTVTLSDVSKSSPLHSSDFADLSHGVHQLDITASLSNTSSSTSSSSILQHNVVVPPSRSVDGSKMNKALFGNMGLFDGTALYKSRRRRSSSSVSTSLLQYGAPERCIRRHEKCTNPLRTPTPTSTELRVNNQSSRLAMAAAKAGFAATTSSSSSTLLSSPQDYYCPVPDCQHLFKRSQHLERHMQALHSFLCTLCGKSFYRPDMLAQHQYNQHREDEKSSTSRCSTLSPMLDVVDFEIKPKDDNISSSSLGSSPRSSTMFRYDAMKLLDSFKPNTTTTTTTTEEQQEYGLQPMNDISFDQSHDTLDLNMETANMMNDTYQTTTMYAPFVDHQHYTPYNYMM